MASFGRNKRRLTSQEISGYAKAKESFYITLDQVLPEAIDKAARKEPFAVFEQLDEIFQPYRDRDAKEIEAKTEIFLNACSRDPDIDAYCKNLSGFRNWHAKSRRSMNTWVGPDHA